ncbi:MAG: hypothetical protein PVG32_11965 [Anaerolineales bacterium]
MEERRHAGWHADGQGHRPWRGFLGSGAAHAGRQLPVLDRLHF